MKNNSLYAGFILHLLVAAVIIFSAFIKFAGVNDQGTPSEGFQAYVIPLAIFELANAILLLLPRTMSVGILLCSAGWGAVLAGSVMEANAHLAPMHPLVPTGFLLMTWVGGYLRDSRMLYSFSSRKHGGFDSEK